MSYIVQPGDTLSQIARQNHISLATLLAANPNLQAAPDLIRIGESVTLPPAAIAKPDVQTGPVLPVQTSAICDAAILLILGCEVSSPQQYARTLQAPTWPQGQSGVTIGVGYDLGYVTPAQLRQDWGDELAPAALARLAACCGISGLPARAAAAGLDDLSVPWEAAERVFRNRTIPDTAARTRAALPNTHRLAPESFGALVSLVYNRGASFAVAGDRYAEMRTIHDCMAMVTFGVVPGALRSMKRLWQGVPGMAGLVARREQEALLFEAGLAAV